MPVVNQKPSDLMNELIHQVSKHNSPWQPALLMHLEQLQPIVVVHEMHGGTTVLSPQQPEALPSMRDAAADALDCNT